MKLLNKLFGKKPAPKPTPKPAPKKPRKPNRIAVTIPDVEPLEIPQGDDDENTVYTYDGRPIKDVKMGEVIRMDLVPGDVAMKSIYTDASIDGEYNHNLCLAYRGYAVGYYGGSLRPMLREAVDMHGHVTIAVRHNGFNSSEGWPSMVALMPSFDWFKENGITGASYHSR